MATLTGKITDVTSNTPESISSITVKAPAARIGSGTDVIVSSPATVDFNRDTGDITVSGLTGGLSWLYIEGDGWTDSISLAVAEGMIALVEAIANAAGAPGMADYISLLSRLEGRVDDIAQDAVDAAAEDIKWDRGVVGSDVTSIDQLAFGSWGVASATVANNLGLPGTLGNLTVSRIATGKSVLYRTLESGTQKHEMWMTSITGGVVAPWKRVDSDGVDAGAPGLKTVGVTLTAGSALDGTAGRCRVLAQVTAPVTRWRVHIESRRQVFSSTADFTLGAVSVGKHSGDGAMTGVQTLKSGSTNIAGSSEWVSRWITNDLSEETLIDFNVSGTGLYSYQAGAYRFNGSTWEPATNVPAAVWIEVETYAETPVVAMIGDSTGAGQGADRPVHESALHVAARNHRFIPMNYSYPGSTMESMTNPEHHIYQRWSGLAKPDSVIIQSGSNDIHGGTATGELQTRFNDLAELARGISPVVFGATVKARYPDSGDFAAALTAHNAWVKTQPAETRDYLDFYQALSPNGTVDASDAADAAHLTTAGHAKLSTSFDSVTVARPETLSVLALKADKSYVDDAAAAADWYKGPLGEAHLDTIIDTGMRDQLSTPAATISRGYPEGVRGYLECVRQSTAIAAQSYITTSATTAPNHWVRSTSNAHSESPTWTAWKLTNKGALKLGTADLDTVTAPNDYVQDVGSYATSGRHYPENERGVLKVTEINSSHIHQAFTTATETPTIWTRSQRSGVWEEWALVSQRDNSTPTEPTDPQPVSEYPGSPYAHHVRELNLRRRIGRVSTGGKAAVTMIFDHGSKNWRDVIYPALRARGLVASLAINGSNDINGEERWGHDPSITWADFKSWHDAGMEIANHGMYHDDASGVEAQLVEIRDSREKLESEIGITIDTWVGAGIYDTKMDGFYPVTNIGKYAEYTAGRIVLDNHAVAFGNVFTPNYTWPMDGTIPQGPIGQWLDRGDQDAWDAIDSAIDHAVAVGGRTIVRCHPQYMGWPNMYTEQFLLDFLDYIKGRVDAGEIEVLTAKKWAVAQL